MRAKLSHGSSLHGKVQKAAEKRQSWQRPVLLYQNVVRSVFHFRKEGISVPLAIVGESGVLVGPPHAAAGKRLTVLQ